MCCIILMVIDTYTLSYCYRASQKKLPLYVLLNISGIKEQNYKPFFSTENWDPCANFEYRTIYMRFKGAEILTKQNWIFEKGNCNKLLFLILILRFFERWLKWTRKKNYLSSWGNLMLHRVTWGLSGSVSVCQGLVRAARGHFKAVRSIMCHFVYELMC